MDRPFYAKRFARAPQVTQQQLDELTQQIEQTERAIRSGLFGDEPFTTDPVSNDWDWASSSVERASFMGWTAQELREVHKAQKVDACEWDWELPKGMWEVLRDKILAAAAKVEEITAAAYNESRRRSAVVTTTTVAALAAATYALTM